MENVKINLDNLMAFLFVARGKSFSSAAAQLFLTQPAVTTKIKCLEQQFGGKLFISTGKELQLTDLGKEILPMAEDLYRKAKEIEYIVSSVRDTKKGILRIAASRSLSQTYLPLLISIFSEQCPGIQISLTEGPSQDIIEKILEFKDEIAIVPRVPVNQKLKAYTMSTERMEFVVAAGHSLAGKKQLKIEDVLREPILAHGVGSATRLTCQAMYEKYNVKANIALEAENVEMLKKCLIMGKGFSLMFPPLIKEELEKGLLKILPVDGVNIFIDVQLVFLSNRVLSPSAKKFIEIALSTFGTHDTGKPLYY